MKVWFWVSFRVGVRFRVKVGFRLILLLNSEAKNDSPLLTSLRDIICNIIIMLKVRFRVRFRARVNIKG